MGYYVRAFCTSDASTSLSEAQGWLKEHGSGAAIEGADLQSPQWEYAELSYRAGKLPILVECNRDTGDDSLLREELDEFAELVDNASSSRGKAEVVEHLARTRFIVACQLPTSDIEDDGYDANDTFLSFFVSRCGGMIQADGEGFYRGDKLLLELD